MSAAAEHFVQTCTHPQVKGSVRDLLRTIAVRIPEGQTTTPLMTLQELAAGAQRTERTARTYCDRLEALQLLKVHDGGRGRKEARYELLTIEGVRPSEAVPLPLRAHLREAARRAADPRTPDLFTVAVPERSESFSDVAPKVGRFFRRWLAVWSEVGKFFRRWLERSESFADLFLPQGVDVTDRATTYVRTKKDPDPEKDLVAVVGARAREPADEFLEWFERTYPRFHHDAVCLIHRDKDRALVRELLTRPRTNVAHLQAMTVLLWSLTTDGVVKSDRWWITERVAVRDVFVLHRKANFLDLEVRRRREAPAAASGLGWTCSHDPPCERNTDCIARTVAENRAERPERFG